MLITLAQDHELELGQLVDQRDLAHERFTQQALPARIERCGCVIVAALDAAHQFKRALGLSNSSLPIVLSRPGLLDIPRGESLEDATLGEQILDIPQAHRETIVEPHRISDHIRREPVPLEADLSHDPRLTNRDGFALD